jgi:hypothetical protein
MKSTDDQLANRPYARTWAKEKEKEKIKITREITDLPR